MVKLEMEKTLIIAEKQDAAKRIAAALSPHYSSSMLLGVEIYKFFKDGAEYTILPAKGHLFGITSSVKRRDVFPVLDLEWLPLSDIDKKRTDIGRIVNMAKELLRGYKKVIIACDYDIEGETIGYNIIRYCTTSKVETLRAKFSTLTADDLKLSFEQPILRKTWGMALAGRARHYVDFLWGVNISRALTEELKHLNGGYNVLSIGRVQGPTLKAIYERELAIDTFVPLPYWSVTGKGESNGYSFTISHKNILKKTEAYKLESLKGTKGTVINVSNKENRLLPPPPFNLQELQRDAYLFLRYSPWKTLSLAESLYLKALISYPRTSSQSLPINVNNVSIFRRLGHQYNDIIQRIKRNSAVKGKGTDPAHPAIYPTGEGGNEKFLNGDEEKLYDMIVRRYLAAFMEPAIINYTNITMSFNGEIFLTEGHKTMTFGWLYSYFFRSVKDKEVPDIKENQEVIIKELNIEEKYEDPPSRFNQSSILEWMETNELGTKSTRADIVRTLFERNYISDRSIKLTELGLSVVRYLNETIPLIMTVDLTRNLEKQLEKIEEEKETSEKVIINSSKFLVKALDNIGNSSLVYELVQGYRSFKNELYTLGNCPVCKTGHLIVIRSKKTGKRFVGCTNYKNGCKASAPLPTHGNLVNLNRKCKVCGWPMMQLRITKRHPWSFCVNINCPTKKNKTVTANRNKRPS